MIKLFRKIICQIFLECNKLYQLTNTLQYLSLLLFYSYISNELTKRCTKLLKVDFTKPFVLTSIPTYYHPLPPTPIQSHPLPSTHTPSTHSTHLQPLLSTLIHSHSFTAHCHLFTLFLADSHSYSTLSYPLLH